MFILYFFAILPILAGLVYKHWYHEVCWREWLLGAGIALAMAFGFHAYSFYSQVGDTETWSGQIVNSYHIPEWVESYMEAIYRTETYRSGTDSKGNPTYSTRQVFSHWEPRTRVHEPEWWAESNINTQHAITAEKFKELQERFGKTSTKEGVRYTFENSSTMIAGDPNDYYLVNVNNWVEPINVSKSFENRLKAAKTVWTQYKIDKNVAERLYQYPYSFPEDPFMSNRLLGPLAYKYIKPLEWEQLNAVLGPLKKVNLICVGVESEDASFAENQIASWLGGKKNDLIIIFGKGWANVYGYSESEVCKQNIRTLFLTPDQPELLKKLKIEILANYQPVDFEEKFKYIQVQPTGTHVAIYLVLMCITQIGLYVVFHKENIFNY